ncbi:MAG TPA: CDP-alcohol phosphatidyltransferase family protein [Candidatus Udaeobacter sp.]|nr:CDP-alcohol phosphatidyltransferase family protein [Candidatus Udaeobacter sp.]
MAEYQPTSHRPIAQIFRATGKAATNLCVRLAIPPDAISYLSILAALAGALCFWRSGRNMWLLIIAPLFCYFRLWFNMLDGMVAVAAGKASAGGEIVNDLPDRISDVIIFVGVAHSDLMNSFIGYWTAIFSLFTAYVGLFGQAIGGRREFGGIMSKPWRMVALSLGAWAMFVCRSRQAELHDFGRLTVLDWTCLVIIAGCLETIIVRLKRIVTALQDGAR